MKTDPYLHFLGLTEQETSTADEPSIAILPVPFEASTSYGKGTAGGPEAILRASAQVELYDEELEMEPYRAGIRTFPPLQCEGRPHSQVIGFIEESAKTLAREGYCPVLLGGEHSITPPAVLGIAAVHEEISVVQLDAHADLRDSYEGTKLSHASAMARVREHFPVVQIGIRSLSREEAEWIRRDKLPVYFACRLRDESWMKRAIADIKTDKVYLTVDVDVFDGSLLPETGTPEPGGLTWHEVTQFVRSLMKEKNIVGMDFVELSPQPGRHASDFMIARLISKCIGYWALGRKGLQHQ